MRQKGRPLRISEKASSKKSCELPILFVAHRFQPFVRMAFRGYLNGDVREPARGRRPVPMLHLRRNVDDIPSVKFPGGFIGFLIIAATRRAKEDLPTLVVYVPIVAAAGFKRDVGGHHALGRQKREPTLAAEILGVGVVGAAYGKNRIKIFCHFL